MSNRYDQSPESRDTEFPDIFNSLQKLINSALEGWKEGVEEVEQEEALVAFNSSISHGVLDFDFLSLDISKLHIQAQREPCKVLGSRVVINAEEHCMEVKTYLERNGKNFQKTLRAQVFKVTNIPADIVEEMQSNGKVELSFKHN